MRRILLKFNNLFDPRHDLGNVRENLHIPNMSGPMSNTEPSKLSNSLPAEPRYRVQPLGRSPHGVPAQASKWRTEAMRSHRHPVILWFTRGQGRITVAGTTRGFGPNNLIFLPPRSMYGYEPTGQIIGAMVHLPDDPTLELPQEPLHLRFREVFQQQEITQLIDHLQREIDQDLPGRDRAMACHAGMIAVWLERQRAVTPKETPATDAAAHRLAARFTALIETDLNAAHSVTDYAGQLGVTPTHLSRACNAACGRPASALLTDRLHFEARRLLRDTALPISEIAQTLGFTSAAYFSRAFHKHTGQSPRQFRQT